jgi:hypothetical protein
MQSLFRKKLSSSKLNKYIYKSKHHSPGKIPKPDPSFNNNDIAEIIERYEEFRKNY